MVNSPTQLSTADLKQEPAANTRFDQLRTSHHRKQTEKWKKALKHLGINENLLFAREELEAMEPFCSNSIQRIQDGEFLKRQLEKIVLEITQFEVINGCFQATCKDLQGDSI